jgi:hypothetical protein
MEVILILRGGLGNQILQLAAGCIVARKKGYRLHINYTFLHPFVQHVLGVTPRKNYFNDIGLKQSGLLHYLNLCMHNNPKYRTKTMTRSPNLAESLYSDHDTIVMDGYFQELEIFDLNYALDWLHALHLFNLHNLPSIFPHNTPDTLNVHVRRGDYLHYADTYHLFGPIYYLDSILKMLANHDNLNHISIHTDDVLWVITELIPLLQQNGITDRCSISLPCFDEVSTFLLMTTSNYTIISNSTFSLVASWYARLNGSLNQVLLTPYWFTNEGNPYLDAFGV